MIDVNTLGSTLGKVHSRWPDARLKSNAVGNLVIVVDHVWIAWIDITGGTGEINEFPKDDRYSDA